MFVEKLNKKQEGVYVIEEEKTIVDGIWEGFLDHDNVEHQSIVIYTGPKFTGERVDNYFISISSETPWKTHLKIFSHSEKVYITYETTGDQIEAEDINSLQDAVVDEIERATSEEKRIELKLDNEVVRSITEDEKLSEDVEELKEKKADKVYVDTELNKVYKKDEVFTKEEVLQKIEELIDDAPEALDTLGELAEALGNDPNFATNIINLLSTKVDKVAGKGLSTNDYTTEEKQKLAGIEEGANKYTHPDTHSANMIVETSSKRFVSDVEKAEWNNSKTEFDAHKAEIASSTQLGHVKVGQNLAIDSDGTLHAHLHAQASGGKKFARFVIGTSAAGWAENDVDYLCDGVDDQEEINNAIQALPDEGGEIIILDGTYNITAPISVNKDNVSIRGSGNATVLKRMWNSSSDEGVITLTSVEGCRVENLQIDGNKETYAAGYAGYNHGIFLYSSSSNTVTGNTCNNNSMNGIFLDSSTNNTITGNTCNNNNSNGILIVISSNDNTITGNTCNNNNVGIYLSESYNNTITGNTYDDNAYGIYLYSSSNNTVTDNTCNNSGNYGIYLYLSNDNNTITGNTCNNNGSHGIILSTSNNDNNVTGNTCNNNGGNGIRIYSYNNNNTVTDNTCNNNGSHGIYLYSSNDNNTITGNTCNNNNNGIFLYSSSNNTITGNTCNNNNRDGIDLYSSSNNTVTGNTCNDNNENGIHLSSSSNNTITGNTCIRGTGTPEDYTTSQCTIILAGIYNNYNLITSNNCMGKAVVAEGGTGNSVWGNKYDSGDDLPI